ncbi:NAD(P)H-hydrate dehydratase [Romeria aff. gracilis LEGE 07310]|uniref:Bifunctional NAD(P)H-hydrate repair enzyme n=1 Tax=Vasconcelosia minhoensis LEGE 07310 TaxID=915328 RepID=A0A8J7DCJ6_9CYAN|nr:NAD(P)H-hydrate dehydratase [Romeria gracilis]MBE9077753.1 NAD(P)H-hydrate dehydratase [Romeria aff. gracilis LEGE 07310]
MLHRTQHIPRFLVTAEQMQQIEGRVFAAGMPVSALMEKVSGLIARQISEHYPVSQAARVGVLVGPGHNGGDALVVARELHSQGYQVQICQPLDKAKQLTADQARYAQHLGIPFVPSVAEWRDRDLIIDGLFGFGLERPIEGKLASLVKQINRLACPVYSIDLPSGIHTDSGQVMGIAIRAERTGCLGLWKRAFVQAPALAYLGQPELIDFGLPLADIRAVLGETPTVQRLTDEVAIAQLPLPRSATAHKYKVGHLLLIAGSRQYAGAALLSAKGAVASGVGMLTLAIPETIRLALLPSLPGALLLGCPETEAGAIANLPEDLSKYDAIALGPGLTTAVPTLLKSVLAADCPLLLDADGLNLLAQQDPVATLQQRTAPTVLTPHPGEFKRLFPAIKGDPGEQAQRAAEASQAIVVLKGAKTAIACPTSQRLWVNPESTPALARGGSGDVLTGLLGGLLAQKMLDSKPDSDSSDVISAATAAALAAVWWQAQAGRYASDRNSELGVSPDRLFQALDPFLGSILASC